jgi:acetyltransferase-like isoleucine patch superfamily enzyme
MTRVSETAKVFPNVEIGDDVVIGDFVILGEPPAGACAGEYSTVIGPDALIRSHTVIYAGSLIGNGLQTGHGVLLREFNKIGRGVSIGSHSIVEHHITIGDLVRIHSNVFIPEYSEIEDGCWIGPNAVFTNARYPRSQGVKESLKGPRVRRGAKIGANVTLLPNIEIGANALIGAGAVVVRDVPEGAVVVGNPARQVKTISDIAVYRGVMSI